MSKSLVFSGLLVVLLLFGCVVNRDQPRLEPTLTPLASPSIPLLPTLSATLTPLPTLSPSPTLTMAPTATATATLSPSPVPTRGPEAYYKRFILIDQDVQTMYVYENGVMIRRIPVSTGNPEHKETMTPAWEGEVGRFVGTFFSFGTWADEAWYLFDHYGSMLIHGAPYIKQDGKKIYQDLDALGVRPVSHGCIRLPPEEAEWFSRWGPQGAHVIILPLTRKL